MSLSRLEFVCIFIGTISINPLAIEKMLREKGKSVPALSGQKSIVFEIQTDDGGKTDLIVLKAEYDM